MVPHCTVYYIMTEKANHKTISNKIISRVPWKGGGGELAFAPGIHMGLGWGPIRKGYETVILNFILIAHKVFISNFILKTSPFLITTRLHGSLGQTRRELARASTALCTPLAFPSCSFLSLSFSFELISAGSHWGKVWSLGCQLMLGFANQNELSKIHNAKTIN